MHPMELLGDVGHVESHFFVPNEPSSPKSFWMHLMVVPSDEAQVKAHFILLREC
jgi:hypothetical protein